MAQLDERVKEFLYPDTEEQKKLDNVISHLSEIYNRGTDKKEFDKLISQVEKVIRDMPEYKMWASIRAESKDYCQLCGVPFDETGLKKHVHHTPLTLYEIVVAELNEMLSQRTGDGETPIIRTIELIDRVVEKHLSGEVSSVVLCPCCHKRCHYEKKEYGGEITLDRKLYELTQGGNE